MSDAYRSASEHTAHQLEKQLPTPDVNPFLELLVNVLKMGHFLETNLFM